VVEQGTHKPLVESSNLSLATKYALLQLKSVRSLPDQSITARSGAAAARRAHNPKVVGSNPASATFFLVWSERSEAKTGD
jgi:hypothetical protein